MFRSRLQPLIAEVITGLQQERLFPSFAVPPYSVAVPEDPAHGDYATNAALLVAKLAGRPPMDIAELIASRLKSYPAGSGTENIKEAVAATPGFVNITLTDKLLAGSLGTALADPDRWWRIGREEGKKVMAEFTDPNPFKEFHIGHLYSNIVGEAISRVFESGGAIMKRANYQGDVGLHVAKAVWGMRRNLEAAAMTLVDLEGKDRDERAKFLGQAYADGARSFKEDERVKEEITALNRKIFVGDPEVVELYETGRRWSLEYFERIYRRLGTKFDFYYFERDVGRTGLELVREHLARGVFEESEGAVVFPGEKFGLHRRVFINSEGLPTYEAKELGLAPTKYRDFPYDRSIVITGSEIIDYFRVLLAALKEISPDLAAKTIHIAHGMVRLPQGKMSSRTGDVVRAEDLIEEVKARVLTRMDSLKTELPRERWPDVAEQVALGAIKYSLLRVGMGKDISFDIETSLSLEGDSGPYLQYTYARLRSILRKATKETNGTKGTNAKVLEGVALDAVEHRLLAAMLRLPEAIEDALKSLAPNTIANYLHALAQLANGFYHSHPVMQEPDAAKRDFRLALVAGVANTLAGGLNLLGIEAPEEM